MYNVKEHLKSFRKDLFLIWSIITGELAFIGLLGLVGWGIITLVIVISYVWVWAARNMLFDLEEVLDYVKETEETQKEE